MGDRTICFIDLETGCGGVCGQEEEDCSVCGFKKKFEGKEKENFSYTKWTGNLSEKTEEKKLKCIVCNERTPHLKLEPYYKNPNMLYQCQICGNKRAWFSGKENKEAKLNE